MAQNEIVLVTGGSGFIGQHIIKLLIQQKEKLGIKEIRSLDLVEYENRIDHPPSLDLKTFTGDICQPTTVDDVFADVDSVFHCAALISLQYPPNFSELDRINVYGSQKVIELCLKHNIKRLIYTSCGSVNFVPYMSSTFSIIINQTESKATTPVYDTQKSSTEYDKAFLIPGYSSSKLRAEKIVLNSSGATLSNGNEYLQTVAIRPPLTYGEGDNHFLPALFTYFSKRGNNIPRVGGAGGKHQFAYAGNIAWGHICAYKTLKENPKKIAGLPVFITDETPINDYSRFVQRIGNESENDKMKFKHSWWYIPQMIFYFVAFLYEMIVKLLNPIFKTRLNYSLRAISSFSSSVIMYNRLRASIHIDYDPLFDPDESIAVSAKWYGKWYQKNIGKDKELGISEKNK